MGRVGQVMRLPLLALAEARGILFPWVPVCMACGIGLWFALPWEPGLPFYAGAVVVALGALALWHFGPEEGHPLAVALACLVLGVLAAGVRVHSVAAPVIEGRYYGPVQGRIVDIDRSQSDALRLTLDRVVLDGVAPEATPARVRVALHGDRMWLSPEPGQIVALTGHLAPPEGPVEPGAFDFQRMAYFNGLGAVGYTRSPALLMAPPEPRDQIINRLRTRLSAGIQAAIPGDAGAFSSGVMTGDRSGLSLEAVEALRASSLAHLLAISGMNMAFLTGFVFALLRYGLALIPALALRVNSKKVAAVVSLGVAWFYLLLSGANVATERAFIMVAVMLGAVLFDRRALSLRSVAISAVVLLILKPESLLEPGFQMSFAATTALIAGFGALERGMFHGRVPRWAMPVFTLVASSLLAGVATAPFGAAHFNRIADMGFFANLLTVPVMGLVVMPAGAVAALVAPLGLAGLPLWVMGKGSAWILAVAAWVAGMDGAVTPVIAPGPWVLPLLSVGTLWVILWRGRSRWGGIAPVALAFVLWSQADRPPLLISGGGGLVGLIGPEGRALSAPRGDGFAARSWLENDGDLTGQDAAALRPGFGGSRGERSFALGDWRGVHLKGSKAIARLDAACAAADIVVVAGPAAEAPPGCNVFDEARLAATGAVAVWVVADGSLRIVGTRAKLRAWNSTAAERTTTPDLADNLVLARAGTRDQ